MTAHTRILPDWPCAMRKAMAAQYLDLSIAAFEREILTGRIPAPIMLDGKERWLRKALDEAITGSDMAEAEREFWRKHA